MDILWLKGKIRAHQHVVIFTGHGIDTSTILNLNTRCNSYFNTKDKNIAQRQEGEAPSVH